MTVVRRATEPHVSSANISKTWVSYQCKASDDSDDRKNSSSDKTATTTTLVATTATAMRLVMSSRLIRVLEMRV